MSKQEQTLKIQPTRDQWNRFIIWHTECYNHGSKWRDEDLARKLVTFEKELTDTGFITLTDRYEIETWNGLTLDNFVIDDDYPNFP